MIGNLDEIHHPFVLFSYFFFIFFQILGCCVDDQIDIQTILPTILLCKFFAVTIGQMMMKLNRNPFTFIVTRVIYEFLIYFYIVVFPIFWGGRSSSHKSEDCIINGKRKRWSSYPFFLLLSLVCRTVNKIHGREILFSFSTVLS